MRRSIIVTLVCLVIIAKDAYAGVILKPYEEEDRDVNNEIKFYLYTRENPNISYMLQPGDSENYENSHFDPKKPTVFFVHGFTGSALTTSAQVVKNAYLDDGEYNIILVCWRPLAAGPWYLHAVKHVPVVGKYTASLIKWLEYKKAITLPALHLIGFSLGAQVSAFVGEELARNRSEKIGRITGLDPAGPAFDKFSISSNGLDKEDATFVDVIHTNTRTFGMGLVAGHADFYVNYGKSQPGCGFFEISCSHIRAWKYYAESVSNPCGFRAERCAKFKPKISECSLQKEAVMGFGTSRKTRGVFIVETNKKFPFAKDSTDISNIHSNDPSLKINHTYTFIHEVEFKKDNSTDQCTLILHKAVDDDDDDDDNAIGHSDESDLELGNDIHLTMI